MLAFALKLLLAMTPGAAQPSSSGVTAWIEAQPAGAGQTFTGFVRSDRPLNGRYEITAERAGPAGCSNSRQAGAFRSEPAAPARLSQSTIAPLGAGDRWTVTLTIYEGDQVVAEDRVEGPKRP